LHGLNEPARVRIITKKEGNTDAKRAEDPNVCVNRGENGGNAERGGRKKKIKKKGHFERPPDQGKNFCPGRGMKEAKRCFRWGGQKFTGKRRRWDWAQTTGNNRHHDRDSREGKITRDVYQIHGGEYEYESTFPLGKTRKRGEAEEERIQLSNRRSKKANPLSGKTRGKGREKREHTFSEQLMNTPGKGII